MLQEQAVPARTLGLLKSLSPELAREGFYLAGGTALALRLGHRLSVDLDFFTKEKFEVTTLLEQIGQLTNQPVTVRQQSEGSISFTIANTKIECFHYESPLLQELETHAGITLAALPDNVAMKLSAIVGRGSKKDFADIAALIPKTGLETMLTWFEQKFPNSELFMLMKSLTWFEDAELEPDPIFLQGQTWPAIKDQIIASLKP